MRKSLKNIEKYFQHQFWKIQHTQNILKITPNDRVWSHLSFGAHIYTFCACCIFQNWCLKSVWQWEQKVFCHAVTFILSRRNKISKTTHSQTIRDFFHLFAPTGRASFVLLLSFCFVEKYLKKQPRRRKKDWIFRYGVTFCILKYPHI